MFARRTNWSLEPNALTLELARRREQALPVFDLTESNPTRCGFDYEATAILGALAPAQALSYDPHPHGLLSAREAVADYYRERGAPVKPERIFLTTSTSEAYSYALRLLADPGDNILAPAPSYPLFEYLASLNDVGLIQYPLDYDDGWRIHPETVEEVANDRTRAILVVHPNNPTGSFVKYGELNGLIRLAEQRGLAIISDEVFADYRFAPLTSRVEGRGDLDPLPIPSFATVARAVTLTISGLSKISALPQMKLAWLAVNGLGIRRQAIERLEIIADTYLSVATPLALALPRLLETRRTIQPQILARLRSNLAWLDGQLAANSIVQRLKVEGGWYVILKLPTTRSDEAWAVELLRREGVLVQPGHFYDLATEGHLVVSLLPPPGILEPAMIRLLEIVRQSV